MTRFSFEVPIQHLDDFDDDQDYLFTLSMLYDDITYRRYVQKVRDRGDLAIWIDNSYNETSTPESATRLVDLASWANAIRVIAPDSLGWSPEHIHAAYSDTQELINIKCTKTVVICVVESLQIFDHIYENTPCNHYAIPYRTRSEWRPEDVKGIPNLHFLGLINPYEVITMEPSTIDTSMPIKLAIRGISARTWKEIAFEHIHTKDLGLNGSEFFHYRMTTKQIQLAKNNINDIKKWCS